MAVDPDFVEQTYVSASDASPAVTVSLTAATLLLAGIGYVQGSPVPTAVAFDPPGVNQAFTRIKRQRESLNTGFAADWWYLKNPTILSFKQVVASLGAVGNVALVVYGLTGADIAGTTFAQAASESDGTADSESGATGTASVTLSGGATGNYCVDLFTSASLWTPSFASALDDATTGTQFGSQVTSLVNQTMTWTKDGGGTAHWALATLIVLPAPGTPPPAMGGRFHRIVTRPAAYRPGIAR